MVIKTQAPIETLLELVERYPDKHFDFTADGEVVEVSPKFIHSEIQALLAYFLIAYTRTGQLHGYKVLTECAHDLNGWPCRPDVSINAEGDEQIPTTAPLLAVEIKSDSNSLKDLRAKAGKYLEHGCAMVWLVLPEKQLIEVYQREADDQLLTQADMLDGGATLPGFSVTVAEVFG